MSASTPSPHSSLPGASATTGSSAGISPIFTVIGTGFLSRITTSFIVWPGRMAAIRRWRSGTSLIGLPLELDDHVAGPQAGGLGGAPLHHLGDEHAFALLDAEAAGS